jgi:hypothetical protein
MAIDSNTQFWPDALPQPLRAHRRNRDLRHLRTEFETGRLRKRRLFVDPRDSWDVVWHFTADEFSQFKAFFDDSLQNGSLNFAITLFQSEREVEFKDSIYSVARSDNLYVVSTTLIIAPMVGVPMDDFETYADGDNLHGRAGGENWDAEFDWVGRANNLGIQALETYEYYTSGDDVEGLDGGVHFLNDWVSRTNYTGVQAYDTMESYSVTVALNGLDEGTRWTGDAYADAINYKGTKGYDTFESYTASTALNGLSGGTVTEDMSAWGAYVDR